MEKKSLIILGGSVLEIPLLIKAKENGFFLYLVDIDPNAAGKSIADRAIALSTKDIDSIKRYLDSLSVEEASTIVGVGAIDTDVNKTVSAISSHLELKHFNFTISEIVANKFKMHMLFNGYKEKGYFKELHQIRTSLYWFYDELGKKENGNRFILKPTENMGGLGAIRTDLATLYSSFLHAKRHSPNGEIICQPFITGDVLKTQYLVGEKHHTLLNVWKIANIDDLFQIERSRTDKVPDTHVSMVMKASEEMISRLGLRYTPCEFKFIHSEGKLYFLDLNLRLEGGFFVDHYYHEYLGYDILENYISIITGNEPSDRDSPKKDHLYLMKVYGREKLILEEDVGASYVVKREVPDVPSSKFYSRIVYTKKNVAKKMKIVSIKEPEGKSQERKILSNAVRMLAGRCKVCKVCDGLGCIGELPGLGGAVQNEAFIANYNDLRAFPLSQELLGHYPIEFRKEFWGKQVKFPLFIAPISGIESNLGGLMEERDFFLSLLRGATNWGTISFIGDGSKNDKYLTMSSYLNEVDYYGVITLKPRLPLSYMEEKIRYFNDTNIIAISIDIDSLTLPTMKKSDITVGRYSLEQLAYLRRISKKAFIIKGIMSMFDLIKLSDLGFDGVIISNHGGRSVSSLASSFSQLQKIDIAYLKRKHPNFLVGFDGGIRNGEDLLKPFLLGVDFVLIGRLFSIYAAGGDERGVIFLLDKLYGELIAICRMLGVWKHEEGSASQ